MLKSSLFPPSQEALPEPAEIAIRLQRVVTNEANQFLGKEALNNLGLLSPDGKITPEGIVVEEALATVQEASSNTSNANHDSEQKAINDIADLFTASGLINENGLVASSLSNFIKREDERGVRAQRIETLKIATNYIAAKTNRSKAPVIIPTEFSSPKPKDKEAGIVEPIIPDYIPEKSEDLANKAIKHIEGLPNLFDENGSATSDVDNPALPAEFLGVFSDVLPTLIKKIKSDTAQSSSKPNKTTILIASNLYIDTLNAHASKYNVDNIPDYKNLVLHELTTWINFNPSSAQHLAKRVQGEILSNFMVEASSVDPKMIDALIGALNPNRAYLVPYITRGLFYSEPSSDYTGLCLRENILPSDKSKLSVLIEKILDLKNLLPEKEKHITEVMLHIAAKKIQSPARKLAA